MTASPIEVCDPDFARREVESRHFRFGRTVTLAEERSAHRCCRLGSWLWLGVLGASLAVGVTLPTTQPSHAQQTGNTTEPRAEFVYKRTKGRFRLCRDFARLLESYGPVPQYACNIPVKPEAGPFRHIQWSPVDPSSERGLSALKLAAEYRDRRGASDEDWDKKWETELRAVLQADVAAGRARLEEARFDLDFDGAPDRVYRYGATYAQCRSPDAQDSVSRKWNTVVLPQDDPLLSKEVVNKYRTIAAADFFYYEGRPFAARYVANSLSIIEFDRLQNNSVVREKGNFFFQHVCEFEAKAAASAK